MKQAKEFRELSPEELDKRVAELKKELMKENVKTASGTGSASKARLVKKNIARLLTIKNQKEASFK